MENFIKKKLTKLQTKVDFEEIDHRLACGWHVEIEGSGQRKRYLRQLKKRNKVSSTQKLKDNFSKSFEKHFIVFLAMNYPASFGILLIFFIWVFVATYWWAKRMKNLTSKNPDKSNQL